MATKILVIDDGREVRDFLAKSVLASADFEVLIAHDGQSGLALAREAKPDLIISDQFMPGFTGIEVIVQLRAEGNDVPAILMTGEGSDSLAREAVRADVSAYIIKPFDGDEMLAAIGRAIRDVRRQRKMERLTGDLTRRLHEMEALSAIGQAITAQLDLETVLSKVIESAVNLTSAEEGFALLTDEKSGELTVRAAKNFDENFVRTFRLRAEDSLAGQVMQTGEPLLINSPTAQKIKTAYLVHALIYVPLRSYGRVIGVLGIDHRQQEHTFGQHEVQLMQDLANFAGIAIQNARTYQEMHKLAITDSLTGLLNRRQFFDSAGKEFDRARRYQHPLSAIMLDIDQFKRFNDTYGHATGDRVLRSVAALCRKSLREIDITGRYGGEEFAVVLPETPLEAAYQAAERLRRAIAEMPIDTERGRLKIAVSLGVATATPDCPDLQALLERADAAMYAAKAAGRDRVEQAALAPVSA